MLVRKILLSVLTVSCFGIGSNAAAAGTKVQVYLDSNKSVEDGELAAKLMNAFYLAKRAPRIEYNETGTIETTYIGINQMSCAYEGLVDSASHPSKTLLGTNYLCDKLSAGSSYHIMKAVQAVVVARSSLVGAASFFVESISCEGIYNVFPEPAGTRDYSCKFEVNVLYKAE